jgi:pyridoxamine 5'-phosphate oxidase
MMDKTHGMADIRREYGDRRLNEEETLQSPFLQFERWFQDACIQEQADSNAMVLSTVDSNGVPDARVVLLKGIESDAFIFYTNYNSVKGIEIAENPRVALTFYWQKAVRQVRIRGTITRVSDEKSDNYFASRPILSQLSAVASAQSELIESRQWLEEKFEAVARLYANQPIPRPKHWGGYAVAPFEIEFWQGRDNRLHDRIRYMRAGNVWRKCRLSP